MQTDNGQLFFKMGEISADGFFIFDVDDSNFTYTNRAMLQLFSVDAKEDNFDVKTLLKRVHPEDRDYIESCYLECLADLATKKYEFRLLIDQTERYVRVVVYPITQQNKVSLCGIAEDITVMRHNKIHIEQINGRKNAALEILSHDLKEPLALIKLTVSAIENEVALNGNVTINSSVQFIKEMCDRNIKLVRSIINHEFAKSAIIEIGKERTDIVWEIKDVIRTYRRSHLRDTKVFKDSSSHDKIYLRLDSMKFLQVINNLLSNAIKFTPVGGLISVHIEDQDTNVLIVVKDNGIGIPKKLQPKLFEMDREIFRTGLNGEESGGFGMSIVKSIVDLHNGEIWLDSAENEGTTFYLKLPK